MAMVDLSRAEAILGSTRPAIARHLHARDRRCDGSSPPAHRRQEFKIQTGSRLEVEVMVPNRDMGFDQSAEIKIDAFNFTKYGLLQGEIKKRTCHEMPSSARNLRVVRQVQRG